MKKLSIILLTGLLFTQCGSNNTYNYRGDETAAVEEIEQLMSEMEDMSELPANAKNEVVDADLPTLGQKIIKEGDIAFESDSVQRSATSIKNIVAQLNGYTSNENNYNYSNSKSISLTVRVPAQNFEKLLSEISKGVEEFTSKNISARDVTEQFIDMEARVATMKETEARYTELLKKANSVGEILEIEEQISYLRADIESIEGQLKYLSSQVSYSTLNINISSPYVRESGLKNGPTFSDGFNEGWDGFVLFLVGLTYLWPFFLLGLVIFLFIRWMIRKRKNRKAAQA